MLYHYLDHKRRESSAQLHATYLVSGKCVDNGQAVRKQFKLTRSVLAYFVCLCDINVSLPFQSHKVSVVREEQLEGV